MMPDLICLIQNHGYADDTPIFVSWLNDIYYVYDKNQNSFKLAESIGGSLVQFTQTITDGFVREDNETPTATISGLDHLEGELVGVTSGGRFIGLFTVANGSITLAGELTTYQVGLPYRMKIRTMRLSVPQESGTLQTKIKRIDNTTVRHIRSELGMAGVEYDGIEYLVDLETTFSTQSADNTPDTRLSTGGFNEDAYSVITSDDPVPFTALASIISVEVE
jgi:hypothetical protein